jgi:hypothetical protein
MFGLYSSFQFQQTPRKRRSFAVGRTHLMEPRRQATPTPSPSSTGSRQGVNFDPAAKNCELVRRKIPFCLPHLGFHRPRIFHLRQAATIVGAADGRHSDDCRVLFCWFRPVDVADLRCADGLGLCAAEARLLSSRICNCARRSSRVGLVKVCEHREASARLIPQSAYIARLAFWKVARGGGSFWIAWS